MPRSRHAGGLRGHRGRMLEIDSQVGDIRSPAGDQGGRFWKQLVEYLVVFQATHHKAEVRTG